MLIFSLPRVIDVVIVKGTSSEEKFVIITGSIWGIVHYRYFLDCKQGALTVEICLIFLKMFHYFLISFLVPVKNYTCCFRTFS
jgi:hypothetical protein